MQTSGESSRSQNYSSNVLRTLESIWLKVRTPHFMLFFSTAFLISFIILIQLEASATLLINMFFFSQIMVIFFAYVVVRHGVFDGKEFTKDDEFGYEDFDHKNNVYTRSSSSVINQLRDSE
ncbi:MAG: hypothetical protein LAT67_13510 [Balneolales bacterium]|nr:hypothetical protein [Balneolales bacterium]